MLRLIVLFLFLARLAFSQCPISTVTLNSQSDVDNFIVEYPNCVELQSLLRVEGADITNLHGLFNLTHLLKGAYILNNPLLANLNGLNNVKRIHGIVLIDNEMLTSFQGLNNLEVVEGGFQIESNSELLNFDGLEKLDSINGRLFIYFNAKLEGVSAIKNLEYIGDNLVIANSFSLSDCSIRSICNYINDPSGNALIIANASGCNSTQEILDNCIDCVAVNEWIGPSGGSWHQASHWSLNEIPTDCHDVLISPGSDVKIEVGMSAIANSIQIDASSMFEIADSGVLEIVCEN